MSYIYVGCYVPKRSASILLFITCLENVIDFLYNYKYSGEKQDTNELTWRIVFLPRLRIDFRK